MIKNSIAIKENSFFDEYKESEVYSSLWVREEHVIRASTEDKMILVSGNFKKQGKLFKAWQTRFFAINEDYILFYKTNEKSPKAKKVCFLPHTRLSFIAPGSNHNISSKLMGFRLTRYGKISEMYTEDMNEFTMWKGTLSSICILLNFHENFEVDKLIGKGSFARVYISKHKVTGEGYAIKAFSKDFVLNQPKGRESLINEIKILRDIDHPHIVRLIEVYESPNSVYLVLELLKGGELFTHIGDKIDYSEQDVKVILKKLISALAYLHEKKIIHRDLKPENLLLKDEHNITSLILADFGLATYLNKGEVLFKRCGTPGFVAPEILLYTEDSKMYNEKGDMYSAGVIFYLLLTGKQPFWGDDFNEILRLNKLGVVDFSVKELERWSENARNLLMKMLDFNPITRISSAEALDHKFLEKVEISIPVKENEIRGSITSLRTNLRTLSKKFTLKLKNRNDNELGSLENIIKDKENPLQTGVVPVLGHESESTDHLGTIDSPIKRGLTISKFKYRPPEESKLDDEMDDLNTDEDNKIKGLMRPMNDPDPDDPRIQIAKTSDYKKKTETL